MVRASSAVHVACHVGATAVKRHWRRTWPGKPPISPATWGGERERVGWDSKSNPALSSARAGRERRGVGGDVGRTRERRGVGAGGAEEVGRQRRLPAWGGGWRLGTTRQVGPTCRRPEERGKGKRAGPRKEAERGWASWIGPTAQERKRGKEKGKRKKKEKGFCGVVGRTRERRGVGAGGTEEVGRQRRLPA